MNLFVLALVEGIHIYRVHSTKYTNEKQALKKCDELNQYQKGDAKWTVLYAENWREV